jgi:hypothetical protein
LDFLTPIDISEHELCMLAQALPELRVLSLCPQPLFEPFESQLTLGSLIPFMVYCRDLVSLSLWVDATRLPSICFYQPEVGGAPPIRFGPEFRTLDLGSSRINRFDVTLVANYLAHYFPDWREEFAYEPRVRVRDRFLDVFWDAEHYQRLQMWQRVARGLPALVQKRDAA